MRVCVPGAQYSFWRSYEFLFLVVWSRKLHFEESPKSIQNIIGDVYCPGKFCLNREKCESNGGYVTTLRYIYDCGKGGACLFVHKVPFTLKEHVKATKTDKTRFFFAKKRRSWYPTNNCSLMSRFNQPNTERKNCVWTTKYKRIMEMCIVQHVKMKSVFTFQPIKGLVSTTVKSAKPAATSWIFLLRTKNRQLCCLAVMEHIAYTSCDWERKTISCFEEISQPITVNRTKKAKLSPNEEKTYPFPFGWWIERHIHFSNHFFQFQSTVNRYSTYIQLTETYDVLSLQRWNPVDSRFWSRLCYYYSQRSRPKYNNQLTRKAPNCLAIAFFSKIRLFEQSSCASSNYSQPTKNIGNERRSNLQCGCSRLGHQ